MTRRFAAVWIAIIGLAFATGAPLFAHEGHPHKMMGTVTMAAADHLMMKTTDGKDATVQITAETKILKGKKAMTVEDLKAGVRVVVTAIMVKDVMKAKTIEIGAAATTTKR
jgi:hypothetical protein